MFAYLQSPFVPFATGEEGLWERGDILSRTVPRPHVVEKWRRLTLKRHPSAGQEAYIS